MFYQLNSNIKYLRKKNNYTATQLADLLNIGRSQINNIECGYSKCSLNILIELHNIFNISLDDLVFKDLSKENN